MYVLNKNSDLLRIIKACREVNKITEIYYQDVLTEIFIGDTFEEAFDYFDEKFKILAEQIEHHDYHAMLERIAKDADKLEKMGKEDPNYAYYMKIYDALCDELQR